MDNRHSDFSDFFEENLENLKIISSCPVCGVKYNSAEVRLLEEKNDTHLVYIKCRKCQTSVVAVILANHFGVSSMGLVTDLNSEDVLKFKEREPVTVNDVIDVHTSLYSGKIGQAGL